MNLVHPHHGQAYHQSVLNVNASRDVAMSYSNQPLHVLQNIYLCVCVKNVSYIYKIKYSPTKLFSDTKMNKI